MSLINNLDSTKLFTYQIRYESAKVYTLASIVTAIIITFPPPSSVLKTNLLTRLISLVSMISQIQVIQSMLFLFTVGFGFFFSQFFSFLLSSHTEYSWTLISSRLADLTEVQVYFPPNAALKGCHVYDIKNGRARHVMQDKYDSVSGEIKRSHN